LNDCCKSKGIIVSNWPGKFIIGLTGNIATGKSVVRRMLEHLGAYGIDADALSHRAIAKGAPGFQPVLEAFGKWILDDKKEEIDRTKLGHLVFSDPDALKQLETIVHPLVENALDLMIQRASQRVIVIEAIKLLETDLAGACDTIWVTDAPENVQLVRLQDKRRMSEEEARQRVRVQPAQGKKVAAANTVIHNTGSFEDTWIQVVAAWKLISPSSDTGPIVMHKAGRGELAVQRGRPRDSANIAALINRLSGGTRQQTADGIMAAFGEKAFLLLTADTSPVGLAGWQVENLVARTTDLYVDPVVPLEQALKTLITEIERASQDLQCEASLLFLLPQQATQEAIWKELGYSRRTPQTLGVQAWRDAALESQPANTILLFKQLRVDRVLRPI
jgi:dephospho-CoA kinase